MAIERLRKRITRVVSAGALVLSLIHGRGGAVEAATYQPQMGIGMNCETGIPWVSIYDSSQRKLILEVENVTEDKKGVVGEGKKPTTSNFVYVSLDPYKLISSTGDLPIHRLDQVNLRALEPTDDPDTPNEVAEMKTIVECDQKNKKSSKMEKSFLFYRNTLNGISRRDEGNSGGTHGIGETRRNHMRQLVVSSLPNDIPERPWVSEIQVTSACIGDKVEGIHFALRRSTLERNIALAERSDKVRIEARIEGETTSSIYQVGGEETFYASWIGSQRTTADNREMKLQSGDEVQITVKREIPGIAEPPIAIDRFELCHR